MASARGEFSSRFGFIMAAAGSAVGLGNIWGFPTQAASNGGAAFLLVYLLLAFVLAYPVLMAELIIGRHAHANAVRALQTIASRPLWKRVGAGAGIVGLVVASFILSFYAIVAGWMMSHCLGSLADLAGFDALEAWLVNFSLERNALFMLAFLTATAGIISAGVHQGIERWSSRLMPILLVTMLALVIYVLTLDGAMEGLRIYLLPDFSAALAPSLVINAMGAAFFSLSLGVGTMLIYGSYLSDRESLPLVGGLVTGVDIGIAVLAGFLVLPAMYVALHNGVDIFTLLPELFTTMGFAGTFVSLLFFFLMAIAALTSSISMLEPPVAYAIEEHGLSRHRAVVLISLIIATISGTILLNFDALFGLVIAVTTRYSQPLLGLLFCLYVGWVWNRNRLLQELREGAPMVEHTVFWRIWPWHVRFVCPLIIAAIFLQNLL